MNTIDNKMISLTKTVMENIDEQIESIDSLSELFTFLNSSDVDKTDIAALSVMRYIYNIVNMRIISQAENFSETLNKFYATNKKESVLPDKYISITKEFIKKQFDVDMADPVIAIETVKPKKTRKRKKK